MFDGLWLCVQEFESQEVGVSSERWVLYFNSPLEMDRFVQALSRVWQEVYQVRGRGQLRPCQGVAGSVPGKGAWATQTRFVQALSWVWQEVYQVRCGRKCTR